jgi:nitroreductase
MNFKELAASRYSVRKFGEKIVEQEKIDLILKAAGNAPTAGNRQPQRLYVIDTAEGLARVDSCTKCRFGAALVFLICFDKSASWVRPFDGEHSGWVDASIVTAQMMFQAADTGLGTTWVMFFDPAKTRELFKLDENIVPVAFLPTGYPAGDAVPSEKHEKRLPLDAILLGKV